MDAHIFRRMEILSILCIRYERFDSIHFRADNLLYAFKKRYTGS